MRKEDIRKTALAVGFLLAAPMMVPTVAHADPYKWCAVYGGFGNTRESCYYMTVAQCQATVSGLGGWCKPSPWYDGKPVRTPEDGYAYKPRKKSKKSSRQ
ncbi:MAG: DUF3551 domain-containing protein [Hyphomicrobiales bacterium]|nr:DUF3551 domain-containing protein [Alphaproteobacteria bacterium]